MNNKEAVKLLQTVAKRGFLSEPQPNWLDKSELSCYVTWLPEELRTMREYLAENQFLGKIGRHPIGSLFGESRTTTISLLGRISYAMSGKHISPEYVSGLATELDEAEQEYSSLFEQAELERML